MPKKTPTEKKLPRISIITPSFNQASFLKQAIESVVDQHYPDLEYLIFDGGSTDDSVKIIKSYADKYSYIRWWSKKDNGQADAINQGFSLCTGDIVAWLNSDDYYLPNSFDAVANYYLHHSDCHLLIGNCQTTSSRLSWTFSIKHLVPLQIFPSLLYLFDWINQPSTFLSKILINTVGKLNTSLYYAFDYDYWLRSIKHFRLHRLSAPLAVFRIHQSSKGNTGYKMQFREDLEVTKTHTNNSIYIFLHSINQLITVFLYRFLK